MALSKVFQVLAPTDARVVPWPARVERVGVIPMVLRWVPYSAMDAHLRGGVPVLNNSWEKAALSAGPWCTVINITR